MFDFFLTGYINGLQANVERVEKRPAQFTSGMRVNTSEWRYTRTQWKLALASAREALANTRSAYVLARDPNTIAEAERRSLHGIELLKERCKSLPRLE